MGGGSAGSHTDKYETDRVAVANRKYGELSSNGFQSQEDFDKITAGQTAYKAIKQSDYQTTRQVYDGDGGYRTETVADTAAYSKAQQESLKASGLGYNSNYDRWTLANGVDLDSAKEDWNNYSMEQEEIAAYNAKEERRKEAPDDLTGTQGQVDYTLAIKQDNASVGSDKKKKKATKDVNVNSTNQSLGISQDG